MLLKPEEEKELVDKLILHVRKLLSTQGKIENDPETGFEHLELKTGPFVFIEHQRQQVSQGTVNTNGLDVWWITENQNAKRVLSVNYLPFKIKVFARFGKAPWIDAIFAIE
jgi:hypothetical protein